MEDKIEPLHLNRSHHLNRAYHESVAPWRIPLNATYTGAIIPTTVDICRLARFECLFTKILFF